MKIVQLESFYPQYLRAVYESQPGLADLDFDAQIRCLLETGFSGGHNIAPFLNPARWDRHYVVLNCSPAQRRWAVDHGMAAGATSRDVLVAQLRHFAPDVLYISDIPGFDFSILDEIATRPFVVGWSATTFSELVPWSQFDLVLSGIGPIRERVLRHGARAAEEFMPAAPAFQSGRRPALPPSGPVVAGSFSAGTHDARASLFRQASRALDGTTLDLYTSSPFPVAPGERIRLLPPVFGNDLIQLYAEAPLVLDARGDMMLGDMGCPRDTSNMRIFEATRAGSLLLTEHATNLQRYFRAGEEVETFGDAQELADKVRFYLRPENEAARRRIAAAGLERVRREHLIEHRAAWLERLLDKHAGLSAGQGVRVAMTATTGTQVAPCTDTPLDGPVAGAVQRSRHGVLLVASRGDVAFTLAHHALLVREVPDVAPWLVCCDDDAARAAVAAGFAGTLLTPADAAGAGVEVDSLRATSEDLRGVVAALCRMLESDASLRRATWLGADMLPLNSLASLDAPDGMVLGAFDFERDLPHAAEAGVCTAAGVLSVGRPRGEELLRGLAAESRSAYGITRVVAAAVSAGLPIRSVRIATPWSASGEGAPDLAYAGPVSRDAGGAWSHVAFASAPGWNAYLQGVVLPHLKIVEGLISGSPGLAALGAQALGSSSPATSEYLLGHEQRMRHGFRRLSESQYRSFTPDTNGWDTPAVAATQHEAFRPLLEAYRAGQPRQDMRALTSLLRLAGGPKASVLETGCGSGYNIELIRAALGEAASYHGIDGSRSMIDLARRTYPGQPFDVMHSERLAFPDRSFDLVLNGASLMHTIGFDEALAEARRVARRFVVLHTVTVADSPRNVYFEKDAYGSRVPEVCFAERELGGLLDRHLLLPVRVEDSIPYDLGPTLGVRSRSVSLACLRLDRPTAKPNHYCTYFDSNYLPRGVLMMRSVLQHEPSAIFHVLCLDDVTADALEGMSPQIRPVRLLELLAADPDFARVRGDRSKVEWYFTATSCLVHFLLARLPRDTRLTYLDADLCFFAPPDALHDEARDSSVQIIEHRFPPQLAHLAQFGRFNVGWIGFSNCDEGLRVVADYRARCIEWCHDRVDGDRFGDQKYLDAWPSAFPGCVVSRLEGANVAWWNLANAQPHVMFNRVFVGSDLLIFFHFQEIKRSEDGVYTTKRAPEEYGAYFPLVFEPYLAELARVDAELRPLMSEVRPRDIRYGAW